MLRNFYFILLMAATFACQSSQKGEKKTDLKAKVQAEKKATTLPTYKRIVVVGDELVELVCNLGDSLKIVAVGKPHSKVTHRKLPSVGYKGSLQIEFVEKAKPDAVIGEADMIDDKMAEAIESIGIPCFRLAKPNSLQDLNAYWKEVGRVLKKEKLTQQWTDTLAYNVARIEKICKSKRKDTLRVMYVQAKTAGAALMSGANTLPDLMLRLAGVRNASEQFEGIEALKMSIMQGINPDFIVINQKTLNVLGGRPQDIPQFTSSQAYRMGRVLVLEDQQMQGIPFLTGKTSLFICKKLYQENYYTALPIFKDVPISDNNNTEFKETPETPRRDKVETNPTPNEPNLDDLKGGN
jgi:iron complex transport system substrate-binding protein